MGFILHFFILIGCKSDKRRDEGTPPYGYVVKWYQWIKPVGAVHGHQTNELRGTVIPQGTLSCPAGNSPCAAPA